MSPVQDLIARYLDDRDSLSESEWDTLVAEFQNSPTLLAELRDQLLVDDYLAQKLAVDRKNFLSQVAQRVNDYEKQVEDTFDQVAELRSLAESELTKPSLKPVASWWSWGTPVGIVTAVALVFLAALWQANWGQSVELAQVTAVSGEAFVKIGKKSEALEVGTQLKALDEVSTADNSSVEWKYADGTSIRIEANSTVWLERHPDTDGKRVHIEKGALWADVAKQTRPMTFVTPQAEAAVLGSKFQLAVVDGDSKLEVTQGTATFGRAGSNEVVSVGKNQVSYISTDRMEVEPVKWPKRDPDLVYQFNDIVALDGSLARNPLTNGMRETQLENPRGAARPWQDRGLSLEGGSYRSEYAGADLRDLFRKDPRQDMTVEMVVSAAEMRDMPQHANGTVLAQAKRGDRGNWALRAVDGQWSALLRTEAGDPFQELKWSMATPDDDRLHHVAWTYRPGEWKGYCDGELIVSRNDVQGNFRNWIDGALTIGADEDEQQAWRGIVFGIAVYRRVLAKEELQENSRHVRVVYWPFAK